ncbi:glycosyltransferase family 8 protein [Sulfurimonas paralvinellae]|uniref:glycosyltransferase family 8 protein n=1 Tax=Sulfurimonas paralvinellae TaxID=317658 RepID=UPI001866CED4|nr:glycosyltransferase family 8 protein [Sulfurimonas paralvinellae]
MKKYNIVVAFNKLYLQHACVTLISLLENNKELDFKVYIIFDGLAGGDKLILKDLVSPYKCKLVFLEVEDSVFADVPTKGRQTKVVYYNLLIPKLINEAKIYYLDVDVVVNGSIKEFYDQDFEDNYVIGVEDWKLFDRHISLQMDPRSRYLNNGSMVLNLQKMKEDNFYEKYIKILQTIDDLLFLDQDVINAAINGKFKKAPLKYNAISSYVRKSFLKNEYFSKEEILEAYYNPIVIHYTGGRKPWHYKSRNKFRYLYWKYLALTPFKDYVEPDKNFSNIIKKNITMLFNRA